MQPFRPPFGEDTEEMIRASVAGLKRMEQLHRSQPIATVPTIAAKYAISRTCFQLASTALLMLASCRCDRSSPITATSLAIFRKPNAADAGTINDIATNSDLSRCKRRDAKCTKHTAYQLR